MTIFSRAKEIYNYREMIYNLVRRDLHGRYKRSFLGFAWTFLNPLLQVIVYSIVFSTIMRIGIEKFYLFLFVALIPWSFFSASLTSGCSSVIAQGGMVKKIYFPREVLPIAFVTTSFINMIYCFAVVFFVIAVAGVGFNLLALATLPFVMAVEYIICLGIAFLSSSITVYCRDLEYVFGIISMMWMYLTPILYPISRVPEELLPFFMLNPLTPVITAYRDILYYSQVPEMGTLLHSLAMGITVLALGWFVFSKLQRNFAEEL